MMVSFDVWNFNEVLFKECRPVVDGHNYPAIVCANELGLVNSSGAECLDHLSKFVERRNIIYFVQFLDESETAIGAKLRVTGN